MMICIYCRVILLFGLLVFNSTFSTNRLYCAIRVILWIVVNGR